MKRTRIKICGITRPEDALAAVAAGADAIGLVFWQPSPRAVTIEQAKQLCACLPAFVSIVALTVDTPREQLTNMLEKLPITVLQFHGEQSPEFCKSFNKPFIKAIRMRAGVDLDKEIERYSDAQGILLDTYKKDLPGGTGEKFNWSLIPAAHKQRIILAGGLNVSNIQQAVINVQPYAVDVSGGVESSAGVKDSQKINDLINNIRKADQIRWSSSGE